NGYRRSVGHAVLDTCRRSARTPWQMSAYGPDAGFTTESAPPLPAVRPFHERSGGAAECSASPPAGRDAEAAEAIAVAESWLRQSGSGGSRTARSCHGAMHVGEVRPCGF